MKMGSRSRVRLGVCAAVLICGAVPTFAVVLDIAPSAPAAATAIGTTSADPAAAARQAEQAIRSEVASLPPGASPEDVEAAVVYALSQNGTAADATMIALQALAQGGATVPGLRSAVSHVQTALLSRRSLLGTAAITGGGFDFVNSGFLAPAPSIGGGSTNYSS